MDNAYMPGSRGFLSPVPQGTASAAQPAMQQMNKVYSPKQAALLPPGQLVEYLGQFSRSGLVLVKDAAGAYQAAEELQKIAADRTYLTEIGKYITLTKRQLKRQGDSKDAWEDMVDSERILEGTLKSLDLVYSAINKSITVHLEAQKELHAIYGRKDVNIQT